jgi:hypothetical protein
VLLVGRIIWYVVSAGGSSAKRRRHDNHKARLACYPVRFLRRVGGVAQRTPCDLGWTVAQDHQEGLRSREGLCEETLEVALCYGWIDSQADRFDNQYWLLRFTPRRPRSKWSKGNRGKVRKLIEEGRMKPTGLREVERAKAEGRWEQ